MHAAARFRPQRALTYRFGLVQPALTADRPKVLIGKE